VPLDIRYRHASCIECRLVALFAAGCRHASTSAEPHKSLSWIVWHPFKPPCINTAAACFASTHAVSSVPGYALQLRAHFEDALKLGKPVVLGEFGKQHYSSMAVRRDFTARVYGEVEAWNAKHGNIAGDMVTWLRHC